MKLKERIFFILLIITTVLLILFLRQCNSTNNWKNKLKQEKFENAQNIHALKDSIKEEYNKNNIKSFSKAIAIMSKEELQENFPDLYNSFKNEFGEVKYITHTIIKYKDNGQTSNAVVKLDSNHYYVGSNYINKDSTIQIVGKSYFYADILKNDSAYNLIVKPDITVYDSISFSIGLTTGIKKQDDIYRIFVTPDNKNVNIVSLKGADVSNFINSLEFPKQQMKKKKWSIGPNIGYSILLSKNNQVYHGVSVGISVQYSIFNF